MSQLAIPIATATLGGFIAGPNGAAIGWAAGSAYAASQQTIEAPQAGDLGVSTAQYGVNIPIITGTQQVPGIIVWSTEKIPHTTKSKAGKGGPDIETISYTVSFCVVWCANETYGIRRLWNNKELIVDSSVTQKRMPGTYYTGTNIQLPDPVMESYLGTVPAMHGISYSVIEDWNMGVSGVYPNLIAEVCAV